MKKTLLFNLLLLLAFFANAQKTEWQYLGTEKSANAEIKLIKSSDEEIVVKFSQSAYGLQQVNTHKGDAYVVISPKGSQIQKKGAPDLGKISESLVISDTKSTILTVVSSEFIEFENIEIAPSKGVISRNKNPDDIPFEYGEEYQTNAFFPSEIAYLKDPYIIRDLRGQTIITQPYQYNPVTKVLRVYTEITLSIKTTDEEGKNIIKRSKSLESIDSRFKSIYSNHFLNYEAGKYIALPETGGKLLIITYDDFADEMQDFVDWKTSIGIETEMVNYSTIGSSSALETYVENYYNNNGLTFLLLVGDDSQVPASSTSAGDSDNNYGYIAGSDHYLDIFVGRFSAESGTHVTTQVNRTLYYERDMLSSAANIYKGIGIASNEGGGGGGDDGESDEQHMNNIETDLENYGYTITRCYQDGGSTSELSSLINAGTGIINYVGHGSNTSWYAPSFSSTNVNALTNTNEYPFIFTVACVVGNFTSITCFAESWLRATDSNGDPTGAVVFCGSTINQSWASPMCAQDEMNDLLVADSYTSYGGLFVNGMFQMIDEYGSDGENMADTWTCFGDPSLQTRTPGHPDGPSSTPDTEAPTTPTNLTSSNITENSIDLSWTASTDNIGVTGYDVYQNGTYLANTANTNYSVTGLSASTSYSFYIIAKDAAGNESNASSSISVTTGAPDTEAPTAPTNLASSNITDSSVDLNWTASTDNVGVTGYDIYQNGTYLANTTNTNYLVTGLSASTTYSFHVIAKDAAGNESSASSSISVTTNEAALEYCSSQGNNYSYEWIEQIQIGTYSNSSGAAGYTDFTSEVIELSAGEDYNVILTPGFSSSSYTEYWVIWADLNRDGDFNDASEELYSGTGNSIVTGTMSIPSTANGSTRMRITMKYNGAPTSCETFTYGEVEDYTVTFEAAEPDTEAPTTPTGLATTSISSTSISISWTASTDNVAVTEYEVYVDGILDGTSTTTSYTASGLTASTTYSFTVVAKDAAGNSSSASSALSATTSDVIITYCDASGNNQNYEWITGVEIGSYSNTSGASGYTDYTNEIISATAGNSYNINLTPGFASSSYNEYWKVWIDFNSDGDFDDTDEEVFYGSGSSTVTGTISIPSSAEGSKRLRVVMDYNSSISSCGTFTYGEVEDYTIEITRNRGYETELANFADNSYVTCYPNPTSGEFKLQIESEYVGQVQVKVISTSGQILQNILLTKTNDFEEKDISLTNLPTGIYIISIKMSDKVINQRIILE